jgi:hypothetical protein
MEWDAFRDAQSTPGVGLLSKGGTIIAANSYGADSYLMTPLSLSVPSSPRQENMFMTKAARYSLPGEASIFSGLADFGSEANDMDFIMLAMDSPFDLIGMESGSITGSTTQTPNNIESLLIPAERIDLDNASLETPSSLDLHSTSSGAPSHISNVHSLSAGKSGIADITDAQCGCLAQALDLLKKLSSASSSSRTTIHSPDGAEASGIANHGPTQTVILENKQSMEAINHKLACCSCADDTFLLIILSMIVLKVLERYAAVIQLQSHKTGTNEGEVEVAARLPISIISSSDNWMEAPSHAYNGLCADYGSGRVAAQLVLSELHRVQRLVNQLSPKLKGPKEREAQNMASKLRYWGRARATGDSDRMAVTPILASTLDQMERDVRKSLSTLSAEIINGLRQG